MADVASRYHSDKKLQLKQPSLLAYFNTYFQQQTSWTEFCLKPKLVSRVMSSLRGDPLSLELWQQLPGLVKKPGKNGVTTQVPSKLTLYSNTPTAFAAWVRTGHYGLGNQVTVQSINNALAAINKTIELAGLPSPLYGSHNKYNLQIKCCLKGMQCEDPPAITQLALPQS